MNRIGFMQGRLTNKNGFFPQEFPFDVWEKEFDRASEIGLSSMEWMFNAEAWENNPIVHKEGMAVINKKIKESNVKISGICANYFMKNSLYNPKDIESNQKILQKLIYNAKAVNCPNIILPLFEASEFETADAEGKEYLRKILNEVELDNIHILFETDAAVADIVAYIETMENTNVGLCYDIGNATGSGKNVLRELETFSRYIGNVHIKDKKINGTSVMLGTGDAPFGECISCLAKKGYKGSFILESYFGEDAIQDTKINYEYIKEYITK